MSDIQRLGDGQLDPPDEPDCEHCEGCGEITTIDGDVLACPSCLDQELAAERAGRYAMTMTGERLREQLSAAHARIAACEQLLAEIQVALDARTNHGQTTEEWYAGIARLDSVRTKIAIYLKTPPDPKGRG